MLSLKKPFNDNSQLGVALSLSLLGIILPWSCAGKASYQLRMLPPRHRSQHKADLFAPEGQNAENKQQQKKIEDKGEGGRNKG